jgi:hypothetical protein
MSDKSQDAATRRAEALEAFRKFPDAVPPELQQKVIAQQVEIGMDPYMARLAAGACFFKVIADPTKWSPGTHPQHVMDAQSLHPDASQIWLTFENDTQYPDDGMVKFRVFIKNGIVVSIERLE